MRFSSFLVAFAAGSLAAGALAGCGGGGEAAIAAPQVAGKVLALGSDSVGGGGVEIECLNDGGVVVTGSDGTFTIQVPSGEVIRLRLTDPRANGEAPDLPGCDEEGDDSSDRGDVDGDVVEVEPLQDGEVCEIEVILADGQVIECEFGFEGDGEGGFRGEGVLLPAEWTGEDCPVGEIELEFGEGCGVLEIEAEHLEPGMVIEVLLVNPDLATESLFRAEVDAEGVLHLRLERCEGDPLPFGVGSLSELAGYGVVVQDGEGNVLLAGMLPGLEIPDFGDVPFDVPPFPGEIPEEYRDDLEQLADLIEGLLGQDNPLGGLLPR